MIIKEKKLFKILSKEQNGEQILYSTKKKKLRKYFRKTKNANFAPRVDQIFILFIYYIVLLGQIPFCMEFDVIWQIINT